MHWRFDAHTSCGMSSRFCDTSICVRGGRCWMRYQRLGEKYGAYPPRRYSHRALPYHLCDSLPPVGESRSLITFTPKLGWVTMSLKRISACRRIGSRLRFWLLAARSLPKFTITLSGVRVFVDDAHLLGAIVVTPSATCTMSIIRSGAMARWSRARSCNRRRRWRTARCHPRSAASKGCAPRSKYVRRCSPTPVERDLLALRGPRRTIDEVYDIDRSFGGARTLAAAGWPGRW